MGESEARREARVARPKRTGAYSSRARRRRQRSATQSMHSDVFPQGRRMTPKALDRKYSKHITVLFYASTTVLLNLPPAV